MFYYLNQLDSTIAILDNNVGSTGVANRNPRLLVHFSSKKIRVTVIGYPILLDIRKQHLRMLTPASEEYSSSWVQEQPLTLPKTSPIWWTLIIGLSPVPPYFEIIQLQYA